MMFDSALALGVAVLMIALMLLERRYPARRFPDTRGWTLTGLVFLGLSLPVGALATLLLPIDWLDAHAVVSLESLPFAGELAAGFLVSTFLYYWLHRAQHRFDWFWRSGHQLHHAIPRVDLVGTAVLHPTDFLLQIAVNVLACALILGLSPEATAAVGLIATACGFFQHLNLRTPRWLALLVQRPEAHCVHHQIGLHAYNYSDFPLWDRLFGTFRNPACWEGEAGYGFPPRFKDLMLMRRADRAEA